MMKVPQVERLQQIIESLQQHKMIKPVSKTASIRIGEFERGLWRQRSNI